jgi:hypothetical protein
MARGSSDPRLRDSWARAEAVRVPDASARIRSASFPCPSVRIECPRCERAGSYRLDGLKARFGADAALPDVLMALATCDRRKDFSRPCGARFTDLGRSSCPKEPRLKSNASPRRLAAV